MTGRFFVAFLQQTRILLYSGLLELLSETGDPVELVFQGNRFRGGYKGSHPLFFSQNSLRRQFTDRLPQRVPVDLTHLGQSDFRRKLLSYLISFHLNRFSQPCADLEIFGYRIIRVYYSQCHPFACFKRQAHGLHVQSFSTGNSVIILS